MLLSRKTWTLLDLVIMCLLSRFLYLTRSIYFTGLSDGVSVYVYGQYAHLSFRYFEPPRFIFSNLYDLLWLYEYSFVGSWSSFISLCSSAITLCIFIQMCVCVDTFMWFHYVPDMIWSLWDFIIQDLCYLVAWRPKTTWFGTLDV